MISPTRLGLLTASLLILGVGCSDDDGRSSTQVTPVEQPSSSSTTPGIFAQASEAGLDFGQSLIHREPPETLSVLLEQTRYCDAAGEELATENLQASLDQGQTPLGEFDPFVAEEFANICQVTITTAAEVQYGIVVP